jgi:hypothetical protein
MEAATRRPAPGPLSGAGSASFPVISAAGTSPEGAASMCALNPGCTGARIVLCAGCFASWFGAAEGFAGGFTLLDTRTWEGVLWLGSHACVFGGVKHLVTPSAVLDFNVVQLAWDTVCVLV